MITNPRTPFTAENPSTGTSGYSRLSPEIHAASRRRLIGVSLVYSAAWVMILLGLWIESRALLNQESFWALGWRTGVALASTLGLILFLRFRKPSASLFLWIAIAYQVLGSLLIASGSWKWQFNAERLLLELQRLGVDMEAMAASGVPVFNADGVPWVCVWFLVFPLVVPTPVRMAVFAALLSATTYPLITELSILIHGVPDLVEPWLPAFRWGYYLPLYIVAAITIFSAKVVYKMTRDLSRAKKLGSYQLLEKIGAGGMGEVWRAEHRLLARPAAVKLIRPEALGRPGQGDDTVLRRFEREAQATAELQSPYTIELYDFGVSPEGTFYYVMELLDGVDLNTLVTRYGPVPAERTVHLLRQATHSLLDAHQRGLVHRDVKPANLFTCRRGPDFDFVKVLDFGLVKVDGRPEGNVNLTQEGVTSGTPAFMPPEMAMGGVVDGRADLYALGCVAYWLLTGELVFDGDTPMAILAQHMKDEPVPPSHRTEIEVPRSLETLILKLLAKNPGDRPADAAALLTELDAISAAIEPWTAARAERWWGTHLPRTAKKTAVAGENPATTAVVS